MWESIAASAIGGLMGGSSSGGGTQTVSKDPWAPAADWMKSNIGTGQELQKQYAANPFSDYQKQAYGSQRQLSGNAQALLGSLIPQMNNFQGFNRSNPTQQQTPFRFNMPQTQQANFGMGMGPSVDANSAMQMSDLRAQIAALQAAAAAAKMQTASPRYDSSGNGFSGNYGGDFSGIGEKSQSDRDAIGAANGYGGGV